MENETPAVPDLKLASAIFTLRTPRLHKQHAQARTELLSQISEHNLAPLYSYLHDEGLLENDGDYDQAHYEKMAAVNTTRVGELQSSIDQATEAEDELAIVEGWIALGNYYAELCDRENALKTFRRALELAASSGAKIGVILTIIRIFLFFNDKHSAQKEIEASKSLIENEGDWERKNRFKTYKGVFYMSTRQFGEAAEPLIDSFATFTCTELISYEEVLAYGMLCGAISLNRVNLKKKVIDSPQVLSELPSNKRLEPVSVMTNSLYTGEYATFFQALARVETEFLQPCMYLAPHASYFVREMRCKAYAQLLESYMSLNLKSMADIFGVTVEYLDTDLSRFIPPKKLNCVVDKVNGVVITNRPDTKNAQYQELVKQGDALLTKLQKYGAAVRLYGADQA